MESTGVNKAVELLKDPETKHIRASVAACGPGVPHEVAWCRGTTCDRPLDCSASSACLYKSSSEGFVNKRRQQLGEQIEAFPEQINKQEERTMILPTDAKLRKEMPMTTGLLDYFPLALAEVAKVSKAGNDQHNPGQPLHWARGKSMDHADCIARHLVDRGTFDTADNPPQRHSAKLAWRALALLEEELEAERGVMSRGSKVVSK